MESSHLEGDTHLVVHKTDAEHQSGTEHSVEEAPVSAKPDADQSFQVDEKGARDETPSGKPAIKLRGLENTLEVVPARESRKSQSESKQSVKTYRRKLKWQKDFPAQTEMEQYILARYREIMSLRRLERMLSLVEKHGNYTVLVFAIRGRVQHLWNSNQRVALRKLKAVARQGRLVAAQAMKNLLAVIECGEKGNSSGYLDEVGEHGRVWA